MRCIKITVILLILVIVAGIGYFAAGGYNAAADKPHWALTLSVLDFVRDRSTEIRSDDVVVPPDLNNTTRIARGAKLYDEMCVICHLVPGIKNTELREGLYPQPPSLTDKSDLSTKEMFYVITHGYKMTGMPAWGKTHKPELIWDMVAFLQKLPQLSPEQYKAMTAEADPGSHGQDHDHGQSQMRCGGDK